MDDREIRESLPQCAVDYIDVVAKKVRYRRRVRAEVRQELADHFTDALHGISDEQQRVEKAMALIKKFGDAAVLASLIRRGKKRCRPIWLKVFIRACQAAGIAFLALIAYIGLLLTGKPYISVDYIAELNKLVKPTADESMNAQPYYEKAVALLKPEPNDLPRQWEGELTAEQVTAVRQWVAECAPAAEEIRKGNERPYAWQRYRSSDGSMLGVELPQVGKQRKLVEYMGWRAWVHAQDRRFDEAFDDMMQCCLLGQHIESKSVLVEQLVAVAVESYAVKHARHVMTMPGVTAESLARFQAEYESVLAKSDFRMYYDGESMFMKDTIQRTHTKSGRVAPLAMGRFVQLSGSAGGLDRELSAYDTVGAAAVGTFMALTQHGDKEAMLRSVDDFYNRAQQTAAMTPYQARTVSPSFEEVFERLRGMSRLLEFLLPAIERTIDISWRTDADCHALVAQIALERYRREKGVYPESLAEVQQAGYLKEIPMDPWSNGPLVYRRTDEGYTLYSVGTNFTDDGGKSVNSNGDAVRPPSLNALDIVFWPVQ